MGLLYDNGEWQTDVDSDRMTMLCWTETGRADQPALIPTWEYKE